MTVKLIDYYRTSHRAAGRTERRQLYLVNWVDISANVLVSTGPINSGGNFRLTFTH